MKSGWTVCFPSATFRREALVGGGGLRPEDGSDRRYSAPDAHRDRVGLRLSQSALGHHHGSRGGFVGFARLRSLPTGFGAPAPCPTCSMSEGGGSSLRPTLRRSRRGRLARIAEKMYRRDVLAWPFNARQYRRWVKGRSSRHSPGKSGGIVGLGLDPRDRALRHGPALGGRWVRDGVRRLRSALQRTVDKHAHCRDQLFGSQRWSESTNHREKLARGSWRDKEQN